MKKAIQSIIHKLYARKSSEAEDKQTLSVDSQISELKKDAENKNIHLEDENILQESHSAKTAFARPVFEQLLKEIGQGKVQGVLAWHPNRLARNAVDAARLIQLMDEGKLIEIVTPGQTYKNTPGDKFMFGLMCLQAKMENDSKGIDVKRGLRKKNEMGFPGGVAKPGYMNDYGIKGQRRIQIDPERFDLVKKLFELYLTSNWSVRRIVKHSDEVLGLRTIQRKKEGGRPLQLSRLYTILQDPFYAGFFYAKDENSEMKRYEVNESVPRMINEEQYWHIQALLGRKGMVRPKTNFDFTYTGRAKCGTCGGSVVAERKYQLICSQCRHKFAYKNKERCPVCEVRISDMEKPTYLHYVYYHCSKRKNEDCPEGSVRGEYMDTSMAGHAEDNLAISDALSTWCVQRLSVLMEQDRKSEYERKATWERELAQKEKESEELVRMRMKGLITDDEEFFRHKEALEADKRKVKAVLSDMGGVDTAMMEEVKQSFALLVGITETFRSGTVEEKKDALAALGSNLTLKEKKLKISNKKQFELISKGLLAARAHNPAFEPRNSEADKDESGVFAAVRPTLLHGLDDVRTLLIQGKSDFFYRCPAFAMAA